MTARPSGWPSRPSSAIDSSAWCASGRFRWIPLRPSWTSSLPSFPISSEPEVSSPVYSEDFRAWLARNGYDPHMGARPMRRLIADKVRRPLAEELLFGRLAGGGKVVFDIRTDAGGEEVVFEIPAADYNDQKPSRLSEDGPEGEA